MSKMSTRSPSYWIHEEEFNSEGSEQFCVVASGVSHLTEMYNGQSLFVRLSVPHHGEEKHELRLKARYKFSQRLLQRAEQVSPEGTPP